MPGEPEWITSREAAAILGVHKSRIAYMRRRGELSPRPGGRRPAWSRAEVEALRDHRAAGPPREPSRRTLPTSKEPPDREHQWLTTMEVAATLGISRTGVNSRLKSGTLIGVLHDGRRWFKRSDVGPGT